MTINELGRILADMYGNAMNGEQVAHIHLFGVKYGKEIKSNGYKATEIIKASGLRDSYATELSKGIKLSKYVEPK